MEADPQPTLAVFLTWPLSVHTSIVYLPDAASAIFRAAAIEFGSNSRSIWHAQDQAGLTEILALQPNDILPCSMSTLTASGIFPDTTSMPVRKLRFFLVYILGCLDTSLGQPLHAIMTMSEAKRNRVLARYSSSFSTAAQATENNTSMQFLDAFRHQESNASGITLYVQSDSKDIPPGMEAENQLPAPVRRGVHCLRSVMLTLKLSSFIINSANSTSNGCTVVHQVLIDMKGDLVLALQSFDLYTEEAAKAAADLQQVPASSSSLAVATAARDICNWS